MIPVEISINQVDQRNCVIVYLWSLMPSLEYLTTFACHRPRDSLNPRHLLMECNRSIRLVCASGLLPCWKQISGIT